MISGIENEPIAAPAAKAETPKSESAHTRNCVSPAAPTPRSLPARRVVGETPDAITSTTRLVFSSMTDVITACPQIRMLM